MSTQPRKRTGRNANRPAIGKNATKIVTTTTTLANASEEKEKSKEIENEEEMTLADIQETDVFKEVCGIFKGKDRVYGNAETYLQAIYFIECEDLNQEFYDAMYPVHGVMRVKTCLVFHLHPHKFLVTGMAGGTKVGEAESFSGEGWKSLMPKISDDANVSGMERAYLRDVSFKQMKRVALIACEFLTNCDALSKSWVKKYGKPSLVTEAIYKSHHPKPTGDEAKEAKWQKTMDIFFEDLTDFKGGIKDLGLADFNGMTTNYLQNKYTKSGLLSWAKSMEAMGVSMKAITD